MEIINEIKEVFNHRADTGSGYATDYDGFEIQTTTQIIRVLISNEQNCRESWGYRVSEDEQS